MNYFANFGGQYQPQMRQPMMGGQMPGSMSPQPQWGGPAPMQQGPYMGGPMQPQPMQAPGFGGNALAMMGRPMQTGGGMPMQQMQQRRPLGPQVAGPEQGVMGDWRLGR